MEKEIEILNFKTENIDYAAVYNNIFNNVLNNYSIVFQPFVEDRIKRFNLDFSKFKTEPLTSFITKSQSGSFLIGDNYYVVDKTFFELLNIAAYEFLAKVVKNYDMFLNNLGVLKNDEKEAYRMQFLKGIRKELRAHYDNKRTRKGAFLYVDFYATKQDYINSCINSGILIACLLMLSGSSIYHDLAQTHKRVEQS